MTNLAVAVFGLGGPLVSVGAPKTISLWFEGRGRGMAMGIYMTASALGSMTGLSLTNGLLMPLMDGDWRTVMLLYAGFIFASSLVWWLITAHPGYNALHQEFKRVDLIFGAELLLTAHQGLCIELCPCNSTYSHAEKAEDHLIDGHYFRVNI